MSTPERSRKSPAVGKAASPTIPVIATVVDDSALKDIEKLSQELKAEGMKVDQVMPLSGTIAGSCPADSIPEINRKMGGVVVVERSVDAYPSDEDEP